MVLFDECNNINLSIFLCRDFKLQYLRRSPTSIGPKYKKAVYTLYKNASFTERSETKQRRNELGILGPVIRAQIRDVIKVRSHSLEIKSSVQCIDLIQNTKYILKQAPVEETLK